MRKIFALICCFLAISTIMVGCGEEKKETINEESKIEEVVLEDYEKAAINLVNNIKDNLKNPESLQIHSIHCRQFFEGEKNYHFEIDYSAQNGFGGYDRETYYLEIGLTGSLDKYAFDDLIMVVERSNYKNNSNVLDKEVDVEKILDNLDE